MSVVIRTDFGGGLELVIHCREVHRLDEDHQPVATFGVGMIQVASDKSHLDAEMITSMIDRAEEIVDAALVESASWWNQNVPAPLMTAESGPDDLAQAHDLRQRRTRRPGRRGPDLDLIRRANELYDPDNGITLSVVGERLGGVPTSTVWNWIKKAEEMGL